MGNFDTEIITSIVSNDFSINLPDIFTNLILKFWFYKNIMRLYLQIKQLLVNFAL